MSEQEPTIKIWMAAEVPVEGAAHLFQALAAKAIDETIKLGQGEFSFVEEMEREALKYRVSLEAGRRFYNLHYNAAKPSPIMTVVMREVGGLLDDAEKIVDKKGAFFDADRAAWDREATAVLRGERKEKLVYKDGSEKRKALNAFQAYLPQVEVKKKQKKSKHK